MKLGQLQLSNDGTLLLLDRRNPNAPTPASQRLALAPHPIVWVCPLVTVAAYLYLRFYGVPKSYKGDGFPDIHNSDDFAYMPLVRGKSLDKYPREETMTNYYAHVFRYCHLPYKRREYFYNKSVDYCQYPIVRDSDSQQLQTLSQGKQELYFPQNIPIDFLRHMNHFPVYEPPTAPSNAQFQDIPKSLLVQVFPEIEEYKRSSEPLSEQAKQFLDVLQLLRDCLVKALPLIYHFFPEHDLFKDPIFQGPEFQVYFHENIEQLRSKVQLQNYDPAVFGLKESDRDLVPRPEPVQTFTSTNPDSDTSDLQTYLRDQTFRMVQFQTVTNFHLLLQSLSRIFEKLETKKSNREYIIHQLESLEQTLQDRIAKTTPSDVKKEEEVHGVEEEAAVDIPVDQPPHKQPIFDSDAEDDADYEEEGENKKDFNDDDEADPNLQHELQALVSEVMDSKLKAAVEKQTLDIERHIHSIIQTQVKDEVRSQLAHLLNQQSSTPTPQPSQQPTLITQKRLREENEPHGGSTAASFTLSPNLTSIEDVILEWFTPDPEKGNDCVHTMNKKYGKTWRENKHELARIYRQRKLIIEFYICLVNQRQMDRYEAVAACEKMRNNASLQEFSNKLRDWKKHHDNSFDGLDTLSASLF